MLSAARGENQRPAPGVRLRVPVARWAGWDARVQGDAAPALPFVDAMLRRRLSALAKMSLWAAHECARDVPAFRMVYASRHGELTRTTAMLHDLAAAEPLSPTAFSMSVLNASLGLYSIIRGNTAPATAVSAGEESFAYGLLEAALQLESDPSLPVLLVYADEPVPGDYFDTPQVQDNAHALAVLLAADATLHIDVARQPVHGASDTTLQSRSFAAALASRTPAHWQGARAGWSWQLAQAAA